MRIDAYQHHGNKECIYRRIGDSDIFEWVCPEKTYKRSEGNIRQEIDHFEKFHPYIEKQNIMSTTFGVRVIDEEEPIEVAFQSGVKGGTHTSWINPLAKMLPDETPVEALDNGNGDIMTIGDIKIKIQKQKSE